ncbi:MAG: hypothetical protein EZS28_052842 [Streblomastix strix]|uniref:Uncharacterized protein n=1 Tax=Streblomastix strix TaxID=222440 RepID=A0A5J4RTS7_9EUKA|nr:MAG: hypothetical protein EZS28_052842 [Streblomastix strix]
MEFNNYRSENAQSQTIDDEIKQETLDKDRTEHSSYTIFGCFISSQNYEQPQITNYNEVRLELQTSIVQMDSGQPIQQASESQAQHTRTSGRADSFGQFDKG